MNLCPPLRDVEKSQTALGGLGRKIGEVLDASFIINISSLAGYVLK